MNSATRSSLRRGAHRPPQRAASAAAGEHRKAAASQAPGRIAYLSSYRIAVRLLCGTIELLDRPLDFLPEFFPLPNRGVLQFAELLLQLLLLFLKAAQLSLETFPRFTRRLVRLFPQLLDGRA